MNFTKDLAHHMVDDGRASKHEVQRSEVEFLMGTQNFFFVTYS